MTTVGGSKRVIGGKDRAMELTKTESANLISLMLHDLEHSRWILVEAYRRKKQLDANSDFMITITGSTVALAIDKLTALKTLIARDSFLKPTDEGIKLIEFWLDVEKATREDKTDGN
jgi:hypothetical protein